MKQQSKGLYSSSYCRYVLACLIWMSQWFLPNESPSVWILRHDHSASTMCSLRQDSAIAISNMCISSLLLKYIYCSELQHWSVYESKHSVLNLRPACHNAENNNNMLWLSCGFLDPSFPQVYHHIVPQVRQSIWHFENSSKLLWNPRYFEKIDLPEHFASTFFFC